MSPFHFKRFSVDDSHSAMKIGTDGVLLGAWTSASGAKCILDVGSGSGLIAMMMAQRFDDISVFAVEVDADACQDAVSNVESSPWKGRINILEADFLEWIPSQLLHPLCIVSNPPFYTESIRSPHAARSLARHGEGLNVESLIQRCAQIMTDPRDSLSFIAPADIGDDIDFALALNRLSPVRITDVVSREGRRALRRLYEVRPGSSAHSPCVHDTIVIRDSSGRYSEKYISLTNQFYLDSTFEK